MTRSTRAAQSRRAAGTVRWPLGRRARQGVLVAHVAAAGAWLGIDVVLGLLVFADAVVEDPDLVAAGYRVLPLLFWPLIVAGGLALLTGLVLGMATPWGVVRHWWVAIKLGITVLLLTLVALALRPGLDEAAAQGRRVAAGLPPTRDLGSLAFPPLVSATLLLVAVTLSVVKPRARIRSGRPARGGSGVQPAQPGRTSPLS